MSVKAKILAISIAVALALIAIIVIVGVAVNCMPIILSHRDIFSCRPIISLRMI